MLRASEQTHNQTGDGAGSTQQLQRQADAGQPRYASPIESLRPDTDTLTHVGKAAYNQDSRK